ncbi:MAG: type III pantothenate kinase [Acidobacteriota bacterium]|jgi:type III pantothenate kinase
MLLVIDVGNTNTVLGVYDGDRLTHHWRLASVQDRTADELGALVRQLMGVAGASPAAIGAVAIASVVPPSLPALQHLSREVFGCEPLIVGPGVKTGMPILYENPQEVGADRIANSIAALTRHGGPAVVVDFGTATTFDVVSARGEYLGGVIAPGVQISAEALFERAARLPRVELLRPEKVIGRNTVQAMQSGLFFGYLGLIDGIIERLRVELGASTRVIATGGLAPIFHGEGRHRFDALEPDLTLEGLRLIHERNR